MPKRVRVADLSVAWDHFVFSCSHNWGADNYNVMHDISKKLKHESTKLITFASRYSTCVYSGQFRNKESKKHLWLAHNYLFDLYNLVYTKGVAWVLKKWLPMEMDKIAKNRLMKQNRQKRKKEKNDPNSIIKKYIGTSCGIEGIDGLKIILKRNNNDCKIAFGASDVLSYTDNEIVLAKQSYVVRMLKKKNIIEQKGNNKQLYTINPLFVDAINKHGKIENREKHRDGDSADLTSDDNDEDDNVAQENVENDNLMADNDEECQNGGSLEIAIQQSLKSLKEEKLQDNEFESDMKAAIQNSLISINQNDKIYSASCIICQATVTSNEFIAVAICTSCTQ